MRVRTNRYSPGCSRPPFVRSLWNTYRRSVGVGWLRGTGHDGDRSAARRRRPRHRARRTARRPRAEVFHIGRISVACGVPESVVRALLSGRPAGEPDVQARFLQRLGLLRRTRLKPNGRRYTSRRSPTARACPGSRRARSSTATGVPPWSTATRSSASSGCTLGFLTAEDPEALAGALQRTEQELLQKLADRERAAAEAAEDPLERLLQDHGVRGIAWRAAQLPTDQHRDKVAEWLDMLLESVKRPES